jgi:competence protein ComEC
MELEFRHMKRFHPYLSLILFMACVPLAVAVDQPLHIYFIDVEGGQATLVAAPSGETLLIDAGWDAQDRDARRIAETARANGIGRIDVLLVTHFHRDHVGGVATLSALIPIRNVFDHGENTEHYKGAEEIMAGYRTAVSGARRTVVHPGDKIPIKGLDISVLTAGGQRITSPLPGAGAPNPVCGSENRKPEEHTENESSVGILLQFGRFRMLDLADLLWNQEMDLVCPVNRTGAADVLVVSHHGKDTSNSATLIRAIRPRAAIMNNAEDKGGSPGTFDILRSSPGLADLWQLHVSTAAGGRNSNPELIANLHSVCQGYGIDVTAAGDGSFTVTNQRNGHRTAYGAPATGAQVAPGRAPSAR